MPAAAKIEMNKSSGSGFIGASAQPDQDSGGGTAGAFVGRRDDHSATAMPHSTPGMAVPSASATLRGNMCMSGTSATSARPDQFSN
jgi:hypothetical protein